MNEVPCMVLLCDDRASAEMAIIENIRREDLNMFEQAGAISTLIEMYGMTQEQIGSVLSMSQSYIANKLRLLRLGEDERRLVTENGLTERHVRALLRIREPEKRADAMRHVISEGLNVQKTDTYVEQLLQEREAEENRARRRVRSVVVLKDVRIFANTLERAVSVMEKAGISVSTVKRETDERTEWLISVENHR